MIFDLYSHSGKIAIAVLQIVQNLSLSDSGSKMQHAAHGRHPLHIGPMPNQFHEPGTIPQSSIAGGHDDRGGEDPNHSRLVAWISK